MFVYSYSVSTLKSRFLCYFTILLFPYVGGEVWQLQISIFAHTHVDVRILNMFPKQFCRFVVILVTVPDGVRIVNYSSVLARKREKLKFVH